MFFVSIIFFNDTATTEIYTLSLHDALPISAERHRPLREGVDRRPALSPEPRSLPFDRVGEVADRKSTRLNSSHANISYAVFCLKKKNTTCLNYFLHFRMMSTVALLVT